MIEKQEILDFYKGKRVFVTGHTGFKGTWLIKILLMAGADVTGYSLEPPTNPSMFGLLGYTKEERDEDQGHLTSVIGDIRDMEHLMQSFEKAKPEIVFHLAAQPLVRASYAEPRMTYETNVMGTVNVCEAIRRTGSVRSFINITTDKVYENREWAWGYREIDPLDGFDPYSNSKSCSEIVTHAYIRSFFNEAGIAASTARAGNVIGGGDFAKDRIVPDCVRAAAEKKPLFIRNPHSTRPYQHVLEPLSFYLLLAAEQYQDRTKAGFYNIGPSEADLLKTGTIAKMFAEAFQGDFTYEVKREEKAPHEANLLKLDTSKIRSVFGWHPVWDIKKAMEETVSWTKIWLKAPDEKALHQITAEQIRSFFDSLMLR